MFQAFEQSGHVEIGEIGEVQAGFVGMETLLEDCFLVLVESRGSADYNDVPAAGLEPQGCVQSPRRLKDFPTTSKVRIEHWVVRLRFARAAKDNRNVCERFLMRVDHELERGRPEGDD